MLSAYALNACFNIPWLSYDDDDDDDNDDDDGLVFQHYLSHIEMMVG